MNKIFKKQKGFTLVEVMIAAGISSLVALVAYTTLQSSQKVVKTAELGSEVTELKNALIANLGQADICNANFVGKPVTQADITALYKRKRVTSGGSTSPYTLTYTADPTNAFVTKNTTYGASRAKQINILKISTFPTLIPKRNMTDTQLYMDNSMTVQVDYSVIGSQTSTTPLKTDKLTVDVFIGKQGLNVASCFTDVAGLIKAAVKGACYLKSTTPPDATENGVIYNETEGTYGTCTHPSYRVQTESGTINPQTTPGTINTCPVGEFMYEVVVNAGSISPGGVTIPGYTTYRCRKITLSSTCAAGYLMTGMDANGAAICENMATNWTRFGSSTTPWKAFTTQPIGTPNPYQYQTIDFGNATTVCPADQVIQSINASNQVVCTAKVTAFNCPTGQVVKSVAPNGTPTCGYPDLNSGSGCPSGYYLKSYGADGSLGCAQLVVNANCADARFVMTGIDTNGNAVCEYRYW